MVCQLLTILLLLILGGCGYTSDHALDSHTESKKTFINVSSVIFGNVVSGSEGGNVSIPAFSLTTLCQENDSSGGAYNLYIDGNFCYEKVASVAGEMPVTAVINGVVLKSFYSGTPMPHARITKTTSVDWHGVTGHALDVETKHGQVVPLESFVSINPFTNLAYWLSSSKNYSYSEFKNQLVSLNETFFDRPLAPGCRADKGLCPEHKQFLAAGNSITVSNDGSIFSFTSPNHQKCRGFTRCFPFPCFDEISSARRKGFTPKEKQTACSSLPE